MKMKGSKLFGRCRQRSGWFGANCEIVFLTLRRTLDRMRISTVIPLKVRMSLTVHDQSMIFSFVPGGSSIDRQGLLCLGCVSF
jgi:hypothetical protein